MINWDKLQQDIKLKIKRWQKGSYPRGLILMYHRINHSQQDIWGLSVSPANFAEHLQVLKASYTVMSLADLVQAQQQGQLVDRSIVITFDDGYIDNLQQAKPLLEKYHLPATIFISTGYTGKNQEFWWDQLASLLLTNNHLPAEIKLNWQDQVYIWSISPLALRTEIDHHCRAWQAPANSLLGIYYQIWKILKPLPHQTQQELITQIVRQIDGKIPDYSANRPMTAEELLTISQDGLITIGAHTVHHPNLSLQNIDQQKQEILESKLTLETILNRPVNTFAYPFGDYHKQQTPAIVKEVGFTCACTTVTDVVWHKSDPWQLPRLPVENCTGDQLREKLEFWWQG